MKKKDRWRNSTLIVLTIGGVGAWLAVWPFREPLAWATEQIRGGKDWLLVVASVAYIVGFFATRIVEDAFDSIFSKPPFSEIGVDMPEGKEKHPRWVDTMLGPTGYVFFFGRVVVTVFCLVMVGKLLVWLVTLAKLPG